jgi:hypothetical protein
VTNVLSHDVHVKPSPNEYFTIRSSRALLARSHFLYSMNVDDFEPLDLPWGLRGISEPPAMISGGFGDRSGSSSPIDRSPIN